MAVDSQRERHWVWWGQTRDVGAAIAGFGLVGLEAFRGTYNPIAMGFAAVCIGIMSSGFLSRYLIGRWDNGPQKP